MKTSHQDRIIGILREAKTCLARPDNDFVWSSWKNEAAAQSEIDGLISRFRAGAPPERREIDILFAATGDIQEVGLSSGWGHEFLALARRMDDALDRAYGRNPAVIDAHRAELLGYARQIFGGDLRWFCTVMSPLAAGLVCYMLCSGDQPEVYFPIRLEGRGAFWLMTAATMVFGALGVINWISWRRRTRKP